MSLLIISTETSSRKEKKRSDYNTEQRCSQLFLIDSYSKQQERSEVCLKNAWRLMSRIALISKRECKKRSAGLVEKAQLKTGFLKQQL